MKIMVNKVLCIYIFALFLICFCCFFNESDLIDFNINYTKHINANADQIFYDVLDGESRGCYEINSSFSPYIMDNRNQCDQYCSSHGPGRESGGIGLLDDGCRNYWDWSVYDYGTINIPYWINMESMNTILNTNHREILINDIREQVEFWNEVEIHDGSGKLVNIYEVSQNEAEKPEDINGRRVIEVLCTYLDGLAGQFSATDYQLKISYNSQWAGDRPGRQVDTPMHEFGHVLGLYDLDYPASITNGTHKTLMGYERGTTEATLNKAIKYQDIQGVAVANNVHICSNENFMRYVLKDNMYYHICFYCDRIDYSASKLANSQPVQDAINCNHNYQPLVSAGERHWYKCTKCYKVYENEFIVSDTGESIEIKGLIDNTDYEVNIPNSLNGKPITSIVTNAFYNCTQLSNISIPSSVEYIGNNAFYNTGIWNNAANNSAVYADDWCIGYKGMLNNLVLAEDTVGIADYAFNNCTSLNTITIQDGLKYIGDFAFYGCSNLIGADLPISVSRLGNSAFADCGSLKSVTFGSGMNTINPYVFSEDANLHSITLSSNVTKIGYGAFMTLGNLTIYAESTQALSGWDLIWNISSIAYKIDGIEYQYNPVVWGCTLSSDKSYVVGFTKTSNNISNSSSVTLSEPSRAGYIFRGWYPNQNCTGAFYTAEQIASAPNQTYYARWEPCENEDNFAQAHIVTFNTNGGTVCGAINAYAGETITLPHSTKAGYTGNWGTYNFGSTYTVTGNITFTAIWTANGYTITFNKNGGSGGTSSAQVTYGSTFPQITTPERSGYKFEYYKDSSGNIYYKNGIETKSYNIAGNLSLTAVWSVSYLDIEIVSKSGSNWSIKITNTSSTSVTIYYNKKMCFENDAKTWTGLNDKNDGFTLAPGASQTVTISENWFATHIAVSYTCPEGRRITYACDLNSSTKTMTITKITI